MYKYIGFINVLLFSQSIFAANLPDFSFVVSVRKSEKDDKPNIATIQLGVMAFDKESVLPLTKQ